MLVIFLERVPTSLKGALSRWLLDPKAGVLVGNPTARVREELWARVEKGVGDGGATMLWSTNTPCGFQWRQVGDVRRRFRDYDGVPLVLQPGAQGAGNET